ncbi:MAG: prepilin peptidase [Planctomycetota bacterium]|nr:prepilin peptidase [Planctomycetota bacterium]
MPLFRYRLDEKAFQAAELVILANMIMTNLLGWFLFVWVFFFGACLGSFLNVFAYRIPSKITILGSSRCPFCLAPIPGQYNFPVLGWFALRGRCGTCRLPISPRYFVVEILAGSLLVFLFLSELVSNGDCLPTDKPFQMESLARALVAGQFGQLGYYDWTLPRIFLVHCFVGYSVLTAALMRLDRFRLPPLWKTISLLLVFLVLAIWPDDFGFARSTFQTPGRIPELLQRVDFQITGFLVGSFLGFQYSNLTKDWNSGAVFAFGLLGACFGISATISLGTLFLALILVSFAVGLHRLALRLPLFVVLLAFVLQLLLWKPLSAIGFWPNTSANSVTLLLFLLPGSLAVSVASYLRITRPQ